MANISFLWSNRAKFDFISLNFYKAWAKRLLLLPDLVRKDYRRYALVKKGSTIHKSAEIGQVNLNGKVNLLHVGASTFIGKVNIALYENVTIGDRVCINDGVEILTASHDVLDPEWKHIKSAVIIEDYAWIGTGATILPGVTIGRGAVVGAMAVVSKSILPGVIVVGNPAKAVNKLRPIDLNYNPCEFLALNRAWLIG
jgi:acetyltransferase-like isoleucine patch superfamily enzyme